MGRYSREVKLWIAFAAGVAAIFFAFMIAVSSGSSGSSDSPKPTAKVSHFTALPTLPPATGGSIVCGLKTCFPTAPTPTAPAGCSFGTGEWEQCAKTTLTPVFNDFVDRFNLPRGQQQGQLAVFIEERIEWPDSCLGVETPDVLCLQVITPGFRFVVTGGPGTAYAEYHTDLAGHIVFFNSYPTYLDVPPTHTPAP